MNICMQHYRDFKPNVDSLDSAKRCQISGQSLSVTEKI